MLAINSNKNNTAGQSGAYLWALYMWAWELALRDLCLWNVNGGKAMFLFARLARGCWDEHCS